MAKRTACITLDDNNFTVEVLEYHGLVVVAFWADWRGACHMITPVVEQVATAFASRIRVGWLDIDRYPHVPNRYGIDTVPTLLFFSQGQVIEQICGVVSKRYLIEKVQALLDTLGRATHP